MKKGARPKSLSKEDRALWDRLTGSVTPNAPHDLFNPFAETLHEAAIPGSEDTAGAPDPARDQGPVDLSVLKLGLAGPAPHKTRRSPSKDLAVGDLSGMDKRTSQRFAKGREPIEARLDLHGMTQDKAHGALRRFIGASHGQGLRCVLVITGKGARSTDGRGVLKTTVPQWLNQGDLRPYILGVSQAQPKDGGGGAFYVRLKRDRNKP